MAGVRQTASSRSTDDVGGLGDARSSMTLELDGGATIELAASSDARET